MQEHLVEEERVARLEDRPEIALSPAASRPCARRDSTSSIASWSGIDELVEAARDEVEAGRDVAAARQREPQVERPDVAHERAVLVPRAPTDGVALRSVSCARRSAAARQDSRRPAARPGCPEQLEHLERQRRRVGGEDAAALLIQCGRTAALERCRAELLVVAAPVAPSPAEHARARRTRGRSGRRTASAASRSTRPRTSTQPSRRIPARSSSGVTSARAISGSPSPVGSPPRRAAGSRAAAGLLERAHPGEVAQPQQRRSFSRSRWSRLDRGQSLDLRRCSSERSKRRARSHRLSCA